MTPVEVIAHRGSSLFRENTIPAFTGAIELGADAIELDVHATKDGVVIVHHDARLHPDARGQRGPRIDSISLGELRDGTYADPAIPTLDEVLHEIPADYRLYVEIKAPRIEQAVLALLSTFARCAVHSFDHRVIDRARRLDPAIARGVLQASYPLDPVAALRATGARDVWQAWDLIDGDLIAAAHASGCRVIAWTVNDREDAQRLIDSGVDGICTDRLEDMRSLVARA